MADQLIIQRYTGCDAALARHLPDLARLRIEVFREFPYLYDGSYAYEEKYLKPYFESPESIVVLVFDGDKVIGASTGLPLEAEAEEFRRPFVRHGHAPQTVFYCGESVLLKEYRGRGIYRRFFEEREGHARALRRFDLCAFCAVDRPENHPRRPADYASLEQIWTRYGYVKHPELVTTFTWKDLDDEQESPKEMVFWLKSLKQDRQ